MKGLMAEWESLPRESIAWQTTSASGQPRADHAEAIPLARALAFPVPSRLIVTAADGYVLALAKADVDSAYLAVLQDGCMLVFPGDTTRRRFIKQPISFEEG